MKSIKTFILFSIFFIAVSSYAQKSELLYYYAFDEKIEIAPVSNKLLVRKKSSETRQTYENLILNRNSNIKTDWHGYDIFKLEFEKETDKNSISQSFLSDSNILSVSSIYKTNDGLEFGFVNEIVVKFKEDIKDTEKTSILKSFELDNSKTTKTHEIYTISKERNILEVTNKLYESGLFEFAYPNIICKFELSHIPNDPYFQYQVTLHNIGQTFNGHSGTIDADIDAPEAWDITKGNSNIIIAVFDEGVTSNHPDLPNTRQVRLNGSNFGYGNPNDPSPISNDNHGNSCAGVIAATMDNNEGIAGIAPNCKIMPLRFDTTTLSDRMAEAIVFATDNGANIMSNSWGYKTPINNFVPAIVAAIQYAINNGVIVVFAAGNTARRYSCNDNGYVSFPANANVTGLLTVGASDRYDQQSDYSPTSSLLDIVAPSHKAYPPEFDLASGYNCGGISGETLEMWSIDIPGNIGYNPWPSTGDLPHPPATGEILPNSGTNNLAYTGRFGGTSHSCPVVAGVAALLLSINPNLTPQQVFNILTSSADKVGGYAYTNGRCNQMGYGRVNAFAAVQAAAATCVNSFTNQTVTTNTAITGCSTLTIQNVTVTNNAKLSIISGGEVILNSNFEVSLGSQLEIY